jgi:hypothetical protein
MFDINRNRIFQNNKIPKKEMKQIFGRNFL